MGGMSDGRTGVERGGYVTWVHARLRPCGCGAGVVGYVGAFETGAGELGGAPEQGHVLHSEKGHRLSTEFGVRITTFGKAPNSYHAPAQRGSFLFL
jgi:hypothetical protein